MFPDQLVTRNLSRSSVPTTPSLSDPRTCRKRKPGQRRHTRKLLWIGQERSTGLVLVHSQVSLFGVYWAWLVGPFLFTLELSCGRCSHRNNLSMRGNVAHRWLFCTGWTHWTETQETNLVELHLCHLGWWLQTSPKVNDPFELVLWFHLLRSMLDLVEYPRSMPDEKGANYNSLLSTVEVIPLSV